LSPKGVELKSSSPAAPAHGPGIGHPRPPMLLADATWYGTLAAARDLGARGVPVTVAYDTATAPARWSRHVRGSVRCPETSDVDRFVAWLHEFGARNPGFVLYPTSDDVAFLIAYHRATLEPLYRLFSPPIEALMQVLDKSALWRSCRRAGVATPDTWSPVRAAEVAALAGELTYPVLVKPRAQVIASGATKGVRVERPGQLVEAWSRLRAGMRFDRRALDVGPDLGRPIIQTLHASTERIYTIDGFVGPDGEIAGALACLKTLQLPRGSGSGVCFEAAGLDPGVLDGLARLCRETGFVGVFDVEFALDGDRALLIDFNPRFYNHMAFEIGRGLPLPWLAYQAAVGEPSAAPGPVAPERLRSPSDSGIYVHRLPMQLMLLAQRASGGMSRNDCRRWRRWMRVNRRRGLHDPAFGARDRVPGIVDVVHHLRYPRSLLRKVAA
jgi:D-aspartate ligase